MSVLVRLSVVVVLGLFSLNCLAQQCELDSNKLKDQKNGVVNLFKEHGSLRKDGDFDAVCRAVSDSVDLLESRPNNGKMFYLLGSMYEALEEYQLAYLMFWKIDELCIRSNRCCWNDMKPMHKNAVKGALTRLQNKIKEDGYTKRVVNPQELGSCGERCAPILSTTKHTSVRVPTNLEYPIVQWYNGRAQPVRATCGTLAEDDLTDRNNVMQCPPLVHGDPIPTAPGEHWTWKTTGWIGVGMSVVGAGLLGAGIYLWNEGNDTWDNAGNLIFKLDADNNIVVRSEILTADGVNRTKSKEYWDAAQKATQEQYRWGYVLGGVGGALLAAGIGWTIYDMWRAEPGKTQTSRLVPMMSPDTYGVGYELSF